MAIFRSYIRFKEEIKKVYKGVDEEWIIEQ